MVRSVDVLAYDGCFAAEVYGLIDLLTVANGVSTQLGGKPPFRARIVSLTGRITPSGGGELRTDVVGGPADELIVPGFECFDPRVVGPLLDGWGAEIAHLRRAGAVSAVCGGAFLLAEAGRLDGRTATTSWLFAPELARRYPRVDVKATALIVRDGDIATTGAFSAAHDLALDLIRRHGGARIARATSQVTLVAETRHSQAPYVEDALRPVRAATFTDDVKRHLRAHLAERYDLTALAAAFHVSSRTLLRRFAAEAGGSPLSYLRSARAAAAKRLLETSDLTVHEITAQVGYADAATFRALFTASAGATPAEYRRAHRRNRGSRARPGPA
jgi:transcriptional regulator GlxA family with amidase domain